MSFSSSTDTATSLSGSEEGPGYRSDDFKAAFNVLCKPYRGSQERYVDPEFPCPPIVFGHDVVWKRPAQIVEPGQSPHFMVDSYSRFDPVQQILGDCWFVSAVSTLTNNKWLFKRVVPDGQSFTSSDYCGAFRFIFWEYDSWKQVYVDDRLPTRGGNLAFMKSQKENEFWTALLEKAYAKHKGGYLYLHSGYFNEAITDLTGGVCEDFPSIDHTDDILHEKLLRSYERGAFMTGWFVAPGASAKAAEDEKSETGLVMNHVYSINRIATITLDDPPTGRTVQLVRLRNPHGYTEWTKEWCDGAPEWKTISSKQEKRYHNNNPDDGEFWMPIGAYRAKFQLTQICNITPDALGQPLVHICSWDYWKSRIITGSWGRAGSTFSQNPHYEVELEKEDTFGNPGECTLLLSLSLKCSAQELIELNLTFGFEVYKLDYTNTDEGHPIHTLVHSAYGENRRDLTARLPLEPGSYCIVPGSLQCKSATFSLRILTEKNIKTPTTHDQPAIVPYWCLPQRQESN